MRWRDTEPEEGVGLELEVAARVPACRLEVSRSGRGRWCILGEPWLWARVDPEFYGVDLHRRDDESSPHVVAPWRADEARAQSTDRDALVALARALDASPRSPLFEGTWRLELARSRWGALGSAITNQLDIVDLKGAASAPAHRYDDWGAAGSNRVALLRRPSSPTSGRVRSWRKHVRDGTLPPILLTYVTGWCTHLLLDGHDRLVAALAEGVLPRIAMLSCVDVVECEPSDAESDGFVRAYESLLAAGSIESRQRLNRQLADRFRTSMAELASTRARFVSDPSWDARWEAEATGCFVEGS